MFTFPFIQMFLLAGGILELSRYNITMFTSLITIVYIMTNVTFKIYYLLWQMIW